jgi:hypothetical protein
MPLFLMRSSTFAGVTFLTFLLYAAVGGLIVLLPFVLIRAEAYSAIQAGAAMLPVPILIGFASPLMVRLTSRIGGRLPLGVGALIVAVALYLRVGAADASCLREVLPPTLVVALGMAVRAAPLTATVMNSVSADHLGAASGFNSAVARFDGLIATALLGFVFAEQGSGAALVASAHVGALVGAGRARAPSSSSASCPPRRQSIGERNSPSGDSSHFDVRRDSGGERQKAVSMLLLVERLHGCNSDSCCSCSLQG